MRFTLTRMEYFVVATATSNIILASEGLPLFQPAIYAAISRLASGSVIHSLNRDHAQGLSPPP